MMTISNFFAFGIVHPERIDAFRRRLGSRRTELRIVEQNSTILFYMGSDHDDIYAGPESIVISTGILREGTSALTSESMATNYLVAPSGVEVDRIQGNGLVACISRSEPSFMVYKTLFSAPQLYFSDTRQSFLCSNSLSFLEQFLEERVLDESVLPMHFLFRSVPGRQTYLKGVQRLLPGEELQYRNGQLRIRLRRTIKELVQEEAAFKLDPDQSEYFFEAFREVVNFHVKWMLGHGSEVVVLLSGGIDSTLLQLAVKQELSADQVLRSFSYASDAQSFQPEIENARLAAQLLGSAHTFVKIDAQEYPEHLIASIKALGQPPHHEQMPYMMPLARQIARRFGTVRYLLSGAAADTYHGMSISQDILRARRYQRWPRWSLRFAGKLLGRIWQPKSYGALQAADQIPYLDNATSYKNVLNTQSVYTNWDVLQQCFPHAEIEQALLTRRELEAVYADSPSLLEKVHILHLLTDMNDTAGLWDQIALACEEQVLFPFMDEAVFRATLRYSPETRYFSQKRTKPILKNILEYHQLSRVLESPKYGGGFGVELPDWMKDGVLRELVHAIDRPGFMEPALFHDTINNPDWFTWNLLTLDLFKKLVINPSRVR